MPRLFYSCMAYIQTVQYNPFCYCMINESGVFKDVLLFLCGQTIFSAGIIAVQVPTLKGSSIVHKPNLFCHPPKTSE